jgi:hypothetical protein
MVKVIADDRWSVFAVLSSSLHEVWARFYSSTLETRLKYIISDAFETFAFPEEIERLEDFGKNYGEYRSETMLVRQEGLTTTYNLFHNPDEHAADITRLRELRVELDRAVAAAYGWDDLDLAHGFHQTAQGVRFTTSEAARREVLDRLLRLNHERYAEEVARGLHDKGRGGAAKGGGKGRRQRAVQGTEQRALL